MSAKNNKLVSLQVKSPEAYRQTTLLATRMNLTKADVVRIAVARLYMEVMDREAKK